MEQKKFIYGFAHYRTDIGDGVRTGVYFGNCPGACNKVCMSFKRMKEHCFTEDSKEKSLYSPQELLEYLREEKMLFPSKPLGISFLGMEPLFDFDFCKKVAIGIKQQGMSLQISTCGLCNAGDYSEISDLCDLFYFRLFSPIPGIRPPMPGYPFEKVWENLFHFERRKIPYRVLIPVIQGLNTNTAEAFSAVLSSMRSMKSVVLDFSLSGFTDEDKNEFMNHFYRRNVVLF